MYINVSFWTIITVSAALLFWAGGTTYQLRKIDESLLKIDNRLDVIDKTLLEGK